jgi:hypothetical protein
VQAQLVSHTISRKNISKAGDIVFTNPPNTDLECSAVPHAVDITLLESIIHWLRLRLIAKEKSCFLRIRFTVLQEQGRLNWCLIHRASHAGYFHMSQIIRCTNDSDVVRDDRFGSIFFGTIRSPDSDYEISPVFPRSFRDIIRLSDLSCTSYVFFIEYDCFGSDLPCRFHPQAPARYP